MILCRFVLINILLFSLMSISCYATSPFYKRDEPAPAAQSSQVSNSLPAPTPSSNSAAAPSPSNLVNGVPPPIPSNMAGGSNGGMNNNTGGGLIVGNGGGMNGTQVNGTMGSLGNSTQQQGSNGNPFSGKPTSASFANNIPPAYLTWKKPIPNQTFPPLYKIGVSNMTLEWTVDPNALKVQPMNLTVALANPQKQTITAAIVDGTATEAYWDLAKMDPHTPLMVGYYTVLVYDQRGPKAFPSPGWLMPDSRLIVALYSTEAYVGRTDSMFCPTCYVGSGESLYSSMLPLLSAFGVALVTSALFLVSLLQ